VKRADEQIYMEENINSPELIRYIEDNYSNYDVFIFLPYLFPTTIKGVDAAKDKAVLIPCLHDEGYAYLQCVAGCFDHASRIFFLSEGELEIARKIYGPSISTKSRVMGAGVEIEDEKMKSYSAGRLIPDDYILYLGRRDNGKNTGLLIQAFDAFICQSGSKMKLILAGPAEWPGQHLPEQIIDLGLLSEDHKYNLLRYCKALVNPSVNESFSRIIYEAWLFKKPVIVNSDCPATFKALENSGFAGWHADSVESFADVFHELDKSLPEDLEGLGEKGYAYAKKTADWAWVIDRYVDGIEELVEHNNKVGLNLHEIRPVISDLHNVLIMYLNVSDGDAVGNDVIEQYRLLKECSITVFLYAETFSENISSCMITESALNKIIADPDSTIIYHHAGYWEKGESIIDRAACRLIMKYHNIAPPYFFDNYSVDMAGSSRSGLRQTEKFINSGKFLYYMADSDYNADELIELGVPREMTSVVPPFHKIDEFSGAKLNTRMLEQMSDGRINILFVGRIAPHKGLKHLIGVMRNYVTTYGKNIRLNIVGSLDPRLNGYYAELDNTIKHYGLSDVVNFASRVSFSDLHTYYSASDIFLLMSGHEGFCVPILEAQYHKLPIIALDRGAVKATLGAEQIIFEDPDYQLFAAAIHVAGKDRRISQYLADCGYRNYLKYEAEILVCRFAGILNLIAKI
jgi:glycosyltransferase involved in cell wall biosynthesis